MWQESIKSKLKLFDAISHLSYEANSITFNSLEQLQKEVNNSKQGCVVVRDIIKITKKDKVNFTN